MNPKVPKHVQFEKESEERESNEIQREASLMTVVNMQLEEGEGGGSPVRTRSRGILRGHSNNVDVEQPHVGRRATTWKEWVKSLDPDMVILFCLIIITLGILGIVFYLYM